MIDHEGGIVEDVELTPTALAGLNQAVFDRTGGHLAPGQVEGILSMVSTQRVLMSQHQQSDTTDRELDATLNRIARAKTLAEQRSIIAGSVFAEGCLMLELHRARGRIDSALDIKRAAKAALVTEQRRRADQRAVWARQGQKRDGRPTRGWRGDMVAVLLDAWQRVGGDKTDPVHDNGNPTPLHRWLSVLSESIEGKAVDDKTLRVLVKAQTKTATFDPMALFNGFKPYR